jgi:hypothetical protein
MTNDLSQGAVTIQSDSDQTVPGSILTLDMSNLSDVDGISEILSYHWMVDGILLPSSDGRAATSNPDNKSFPLEQSEVGLQVAVQVTYLDSDGITEVVQSEGVMI